MYFDTNGINMQCKEGVFFYIREAKIPKGHSNVQLEKELTLLWKRMENEKKAQQTTS